MKEPLSSEELWWNWKKSEKEQWSWWQRRHTDSEMVFVNVMAETGQIKIYGDRLKLKETSLYKFIEHGDIFSKRKGYKINEGDWKEGPDFHEPTQTCFLISWRLSDGKMISRKELEQILAKEKTEEVEITYADEAMARAVDIREDEDEGDDSKAEGEDEVDEKLTRKWKCLNI
ncbi:Plastid transcriptionally active 12 protein [Thalictrum thalictroides]|uniref:Plastid transcriptionally active 12 protein n=1 Tax=Thalictrum thalictroides TaxID=46969 RepID=A0A7J6XFF9_THATH|nr:Plastid transcriptionally active 12 protein [Thalictrum thalictroides]